MHVQNYSNVDLPLNIKGHSYTLKANAVTFIPDGVITLAKLQEMFGGRNVGTATSAENKGLLSTQQKVSTGKVYMLEHDPQGDYPRLYVAEGTEVSVYGSDNETLPTAYTAMNCPDENQGVTGLLLFGMLPKYVAFKYDSGTGDIILNNCHATEVGTIS